MKRIVADIEAVVDGMVDEIDRQAAGLEATLRLPWRSLELATNLSAFITLCTAQTNSHGPRA